MALPQEPEIVRLLARAAAGATWPFYVPPIHRYVTVSAARTGLFMVQLMVADFLDYTFLGVVIVAIAIAILIIRINKQ